jgi:preprotein translocase subunit SecE
MASTNGDEKISMATDVISPGADEPDDRRPPQRTEAVQRSGFFTIYKKGQGYWTRICTAGGAVLFLVFLMSFLYRYLPIWIRPFIVPDNAVGAQADAATATAERIAIGICAAVGLLFVFFAWRIMNKPDNADFLIATDSEMKKVNWTSQKELVGSTKVVIFFMLVIATVLFLIDVIFGYFFWLITVLKARPF